MARLLHGSGLRLMECLRLHYKDIDLDYQQIYIRDAKDDKEGRTPNPKLKPH